MGRNFRHYFLKLASSIKLLDLFMTDTEMADSGVSAEYVLDNIWIVGSPDQLDSNLRSLYHDVGGFGALLRMGTRK